jgi:hypothetical protein
VGRLEIGADTSAPRQEVVDASIVGRIERAKYLIVFDSHRSNSTSVKRRGQAKPELRFRLRDLDCQAEAEGI